MANLLLTIIAARDAANHPGPSCKIAQLLSSLDEEDRAGLIIAFQDLGITTTAIYKGLRRAGYDISQSTVARHRRGDCTCEPRLLG